MADFFPENVREPQGAIASIHEKYAVEASRVDAAKPTTTDVETSAAPVDDMVQSLVREHTTFKGGVASDTNKLAA